MISNLKKIHFVGICGTGMGATAILMKEKGHVISGSDSGAYDPMKTYLESNGIDFAKEYSPQNIPEDVDMIVLGGSRNTLNDTNPEVAKARSLDVPVRSYADVLGDILKLRSTITCVGSYGKSSTTALMAHCLLNSGIDAGYMFGAVCPNMPSASMGNSEFFVIEGDEYPAGIHDSCAKFLYYNAHDVLLTSAVHDHVNIYKTHSEYLEPFRSLINGLPHDGFIVANFDEQHARKLAEDYSAKKQGRTIFYSLDNSDADYYANGIEYGEKTMFDLYRRGEKITTLVTSMLGAHSVENIVGVSAMLLEKKLVSAEQLRSGVMTFSGLQRRLDKKTHKSQIAVYEGFGTSYDKARSSISAIKLHFPDKRLFILFEPHTFSWRDPNMKHWYEDAFCEAEQMFLYRPPVFNKTHNQLSAEDIKGILEKSGVLTTIVGPGDAEKIANQLTEDCILLMLTSGNMGGLVESVPRLLDDKS